ncbi:O80 family O-antigen polymerase [Escherichia coli]|uniref:O80 family O-antigen polymerase n=1 Tax=Escherichia coli TaxID=562 RepID=UPI0021A9049F|nr:O80 family O-antigen polymerase [Escherichia coli]
MTSLRLKDSFFIFILLVITSKYMIFSILPIGNVINVLACMLSLFLLFRRRFIVKIKSTTQKLGCIFFILSLLLFNISKFSDELTLFNAIIPTGLIMVFMVLIPLAFDKFDLIDALKKYSVFNFWLLVLGLTLYFLNLLGFLGASSLVAAADHANQDGYVSLLNLAYYPSWINIKVSSFIIHRFSGVFWEPGTLGLYLIFLITIEIILFEHEKLGSKIRIFVFILSGVASLSLLFFVSVVVLYFFHLVSQKKDRKTLLAYSLLICILTFICVYYYDYLYQAVLYRLDFDTQRGFVGNTRSGVVFEFWNQFSSGGLLSQLIGFGPYSKFEGDSTSIMIKIYQRGILGFIFLFLSFVCFSLKSSKLFFMPAWILALIILSQFEGAIFLVMMMLFSILCKYKMADHNQTSLS